MADANDLRRLIRRRGADARNRASADMRDELREAARQNHGQRDYGQRTGNLERSIRMSPRDENTAFGTEAAAEASYAEFVDAGTPPHEIRARRASALHFYWHQVGRFVFFERVRHPGTQGSRFFTNTVARWPEIVGEAWRRSRVR